MKTTKIGMVLIASFLFIQFILATNTVRDHSINLAKNLVKGICSYVQLSDSQLVVLKINAATYETKYKSYKGILDVENKNKLINEAYLEYRTSIDSLLRPDQKDSLESRRQRNLFIKKNQ